jgi:hypothetical protein
MAYPDANDAWRIGIEITVGVCLWGKFSLGTRTALQIRILEIVGKKHLHFGPLCARRSVNVGLQTSAGYL